MHKKLTLAAAGCLLAFGGGAAAQQPAPAPLGKWIGQIDFGARVTSVSGDHARYERFRDLRDGAATTLSIGKETDRYVFTAGAENIGYQNQRYEASYDHSGRIKLSFLWDSVPFNYSYISQTPWVEQSPGVFTLDRATRLLVQQATPGVVGVPVTAAQLGTASIYRGLARPIDIQTRRDVAGFDGTFMATRDIALNVGFSSSARTGSEPKGASFGFSVASQLPMPLDDRTNDLTVAGEWLNRNAMLRLAWIGSWFRNDIHEILFDNPVRADDTYPIDASGYSNGRGAARSRLAAPPSNSLNTVSLTGLHKLPGRSSVNGTVSFTAMRQNDALIPWTSNQVINSPEVFAHFPALARLPRSTAEAKVDGVNALLAYTTRPNRFFGLTMRYRFNDRRNLTPLFDGTEYVRMDAVPEESGGPTSPFDIRQNTIDLNATFSIFRHTDLRVGYTLDDFKRTGREIGDSTDYTFRTTLDTFGSQYVMVRLIYERSARVGTGLDHERLAEAGFQPGLRTYDVADRTRNRGWVVVTVTPTSILDVTFSLAAARDRFDGEGQEFGLLSNDNTVYSLTVNAHPTQRVQIGATYGRDTYKALQRARNANPDCGLCPATRGYNSWFDPNRNWLLDQDEEVNNASVYVDLLRAIKEVDVRVSYDYSDSDNAYIHSGPRIEALKTATALTPGDSRPCAAGLASCFRPLPPITNNWHRAMVDLRYMLTPTVGLGLGYWYERFNVSDYATVDLTPGTPRIDYLGTIGTGYGNRPYRASTGFVRLLFAF